jgi:Tol biopolymer transport system component
MMNMRRYFFRRPLLSIALAVIVCFPYIVACGTADSFQTGQAAGTSGQILFVADGDVMLWRDGDISQITSDGNAESPTWSPAGDRFAYVQNHGDFSDIVIARRDGEPLVQLTSSDSGLTHFTEDHVFLAAWAREPDWSPVGEELVYISDKGGLDSFSRNMYIWIAEFGVGAAPYPLDASQRVSLSQEGPVYSSDGSQLAFSVREDQGSGVRYQEVWILNLDTGFFEPLVVDTDGAFDPDWAPDGEDLVYVQREGENSNLWIAPTTGGEPYRLAETGSAVEPVWSPDGKQIAFIHVVDVAFEVWVVDVERSATGNYSAGEPRRLFSADNIDSTSGLSWFSGN